MNVYLGPAAHYRRIPTQEERMNAPDRIRLTGRCHTADQHHRMDGDAADARSQDRALREALAERDEARQDAARYARTAANLLQQRNEAASELERVTDERNERLTLAESSRLAKRLDAAEEERDDYARRLKALDASWARLADERDRARADVHHDIARQLDILAADPGILRDWLTTCDPMPTSFGELFAALAEKLRRADHDTAPGGRDE